MNQYKSCYKILETESTDQIVSNLRQNEGESNEPFSKKRKWKFSAIFELMLQIYTHLP